jgi:hypothetical protein
LLIGAVNSIHNEDNVFKTLSIEGNEIKFKIDTGSQANIIPLPTFENMNLKQTRLEIPTAKLTSYTGDYLPVVGECNLNCNNKTMKFFVVKTGQVPIIGLKAYQELNLIKIIMNVNNVLGQPTETIPEKFPEVFQGLGCLKKPYYIEVDPAITPVVSPLRSTPVALRERLRSCLGDMEEKGVVEKVDGPTE